MLNSTFLIVSIITQIVIALAAVGGLSYQIYTNKKKQKQDKPKYPIIIISISVVLLLTLSLIFTFYQYNKLIELKEKIKYRDALTNIRDQLYNEIITGYEDFINDPNLINAPVQADLLRSLRLLHEQTVQIDGEHLGLGLAMYRLDHLTYISILLSATSVNSPPDAVKWTNNCLDYSQSLLDSVRYVRNNSADYKALVSWINGDDLESRTHYLRSWAYCILLLNSEYSALNPDTLSARINGELRQIETYYLIKYSLSRNHYFNLPQIRGVISDEFFEYGNRPAAHTRSEQSVSDST